MTPGLANKIAIPKATKVCCNFPETLNNLPEGKAIVTGTPIRKDLFEGNAANAMTYCGFTEVKPTLLIIGGSTGSVRINEAIWSCLDELTKTYNIIHLCGKEKTNEQYNNVKGYVQYEYVKKELSDMLALADVVVSRAGANVICEQKAGAVISYIDKATVYPRELIDVLTKAADREKLPYQFKRLATGGNDSASLQRSAKGAKVLSMSAPVRYIHSPASTANTADIESMEKMLLLAVNEFGALPKERQ